MLFYLPAAPRGGQWVELTGDDAAHAVRVLRMRPGDTFEAYDDAENLYRCCIEEADKSRVTARIISGERRSNQPSVAVTVYAGLSKGERFDYLVQKCVECGVHRIVPFISEHCVAVPRPEDYEKKRVRFQRIAMEAGKQSRRSKVVEVGEIVSFDAMLGQAAEADTRIFLYERENRTSLSGALGQVKPGGTVALVSGPEGGFSPAEAQLALEGGLESVSIGPRIMRCETAPVAALCAIMYHSGNFDIGV